MSPGVVSGTDSDSDSDSDGAPEAVSSKSPLETTAAGDIQAEALVPADDSSDEDEAVADPEPLASVPVSKSQHPKNHRAKQPKRPPRNPFMQRPSLLQSVSSYLSSSSATLTTPVCSFYSLKFG